MSDYPFGTVVAINSSQGPINRVVVQDYGNVICVCRSEELAAAKEQLRQPFSIGFRKTDIIKIIRRPNNRGNR